jgi:outer membrane lipoprotein carrier protein
MYRVLILAFLSNIICASDIKLPMSFSSSFEQIVTNPKKKVIRYRGDLKFVYPSIIKWHYTKPTQKDVCSDSEHITVVDYDLEQVSLYYLNKRFNIAKILSNAKHYKKNIYIAKYQDKSYTIALDSHNRLESMAYYDDLDNKVQIIFRKVSYRDKPFSSRVMRCNIPKDYDIIKG